MRRFFDSLNTPLTALVVMTITVAVASFLFFRYYLPRITTPAGPASLPTLTVQGTKDNDAVLVGAGDIAKCNDPRDEKTAELLDGIPGTVFTTGDNAYESGTTAEYQNCYDPGWGRHKARTYPTPGSHDYYTAGASGYFGYFGAAAGDPNKGYYSYDLGEWHIISLNSQCGRVGGCGSTSPMVTWLRQDLSANPVACTLAYWYTPVFSSGSVHGNDPKMKPSWQALYDADAEVVLSGHSHNYERFAPQDANGMADPERGIREFVVGTGGPTVHGFGTIQPNSEVRNSNTSGVLKLTLHPTSYDWEFVPVAGKTFTDSGSESCHWKNLEQSHSDRVNSNCLLCQVGSSSFANSLAPCWTPSGAFGCA